MPDHIVELKPRPRDKVLVRLSGGRFFTIPEEAAKALSVDMVLSEGELERLDRMDQYLRGKEKALRLLSLRSRTRAEIKTALGALSIDSTIRSGLIKELEELGLIDDRRFAREYVRVKTDVKRMGPHRLRHDMKRLGIAGEIVEEILDASFDSQRQETMAWDLVSRKLGEGPVDEKAVRRVSGFLRRKGFDYEVINRVSYELLRRSRRFEDQ